MPPYPMLLRNACGKISRLDIAAATVRPENSTVRPAVVMVRVIAVADGVRVVVRQQCRAPRGTG